MSFSQIITRVSVRVVSGVVSMSVLHRCWHMYYIQLIHFIKLVPVSTCQFRGRFCVETNNTFDQRRVLCPTSHDIDICDYIQDQVYSVHMR